MPSLLVFPRAHSRRCDRRRRNRLRGARAAVRRTCPERRRFLQGQDRRSLDRLQRRRRIRHLRALARPPYGQAHPRQSHLRSAATCRAPAASCSPTGSTTSGPRTAPPSASSARGTGFDPLLGIEAAKFDPDKFLWIGSMNNEVSVCVSWHTSGITKFEDSCCRRKCSSAAPARRPTPTSSRASPTACSAPNSRSCPAIPAATTSTSRWSAARSTAAAAGRGRA